MGLKIFLTSDLHLGMKFAGYPGVQAELADARFGTLEKMIASAGAENCDLFVVAGDLFDRTTVAKKDAIRAAHLIGQFAGRLAVVLPGNHDFYLKGHSELWTQFAEAAPNVLLLTETRPYPLSHYDIDAVLYPAPCSSKHSSENCTGWISREGKHADGKYHIGIAHGSLEGVSPDFGGNYYPMTLQQLKQCGLDMWLLGHTHIQYPATPGLKDTVFYAGTPEPDGFDCRHEGRALILNVDDTGIRAIPIPTGRYAFVHEEREIRGAADLRQLREKYSSGLFRETLVKLRLHGRLPHEEYLSIPKLFDAVRHEIFHLVLDDDGLTEEITTETINREFAADSFPHRLLMGLAHEPDALQMAYDLIQEARR